MQISLMKNINCTSIFLQEKKKEKDKQQGKKGGGGLRGFYEQSKKEKGHDQIYEIWLFLQE